MSVEGDAYDMWLCVLEVQAISSTRLKNITTKEANDVAKSFIKLNL